MASVTTADKEAGKQKRGKRPARRLLTVDEYYRMAEAGIFGPEERVELIDGEIIEMAAIGSRHAACVRVLSRWPILRTDDRAVLSPQLPLRLSQRAEPEPDIVLLRPRPDEYRDAHPGAEDVLLLIEVADSSLSFDRRRKLPIYARDGVPETWLGDLQHDRIEAHRRPEHGRYQDLETFPRGARLSPLAFPDLSIAVDEILG
jgi:Uma2 family endonuclease